MIIPPPIPFVPSIAGGIGSSSSFNNYNHKDVKCFTKFLLKNINKSSYRLGIGDHERHIYAPYFDSLGSLLNKRICTISYLVTCLHVKIYDHFNSDLVKKLLKEYCNKNYTDSKITIEYDEMNITNNKFFDYLDKEIIKMIFILIFLGIIFAVLSVMFQTIK